MMILSLGLDVSKGYADGVFLDPAGRRLPPCSGRFDDTPTGHAAVRQALSELAAQYPDARFRLGLEASGGLERNWLATLVAWTQEPGQQARAHAVYHLNALAVKRFRDRELHGSTTDARSARAIAEYLRTSLRPADRPYVPREEGLLVRYRFLCNTRDRAVQLQNELHALLPAVHPDLVQYCRKGFPDWVLRLLAKYPTAPSLARARPITLARIPYLTQERALALVAAAKTSVAALGDGASGATVTALAQEIQRLQTQVAALKAELGAQLEHDPVVRRLVTIPSIGLWTAVVLRLELGDFDRFRSAAALVSYAGLDPRYHESGDGTSRYSISKRGRREVRAALYMAAFSGLQWNPVLQAFYQRLVGQGKLSSVALTACMAKLLRLAYACVTTERDWDPDYEARRRQERAAATTPTATVAPTVPDAQVAPASGSLQAPVSRREAQRRRAATRPQAGRTRRERGPSAALATYDTAAAPPGQPVLSGRKTP